MEQIVILIFFVVVSAISSYLQNKKKRQAELQAEQLENTPDQPPRRPPPVLPGPFKDLPKKAADWQEQLRRILEDQMPPVIRPVPPPPAAPPALPIPPPAVLGTPLRVEPRLAAASKTTLRDRARARTPAARVARWTASPQNLRDAFVASLIFSPPVSLASHDERRSL